MTTSELALLISFGSLLVAATSLGWNIYRDVVRKPRLRVSIMNGVIAEAVTERRDRRVVVSVTNFGPSKTRACMLHLRKSSWWRRLSRRQVFAVLMPDYVDPLSGKIPSDLDVGQRVDFTFRHAKDIFLRDDYTQIGVIDPFGRIHWCKKDDYRRARAGYLKSNDEQK